MTDEKNSVQTNVNGDYAGPPKSHEFQNNTTDGEKEAATDQEVVLPAVETDKQFTDKEILQKKAEYQGDNKDNELLRAIVRSEDLEDFSTEKQKEKKKSFSVDFSAFSVKDILKRWHKVWRDFYEKNIRLFFWLNMLWMIAKVSFYCIGLSFFGLCVFVYFSFEPIVRSYLDNRGLSNITFSGINHSLTEFALYNLKEKNGLFTIKKIKVQYSFADLLNKKIPLVEIDGMRLYIQEDAGKARTAEAFFKILWNLGFLEQGSIFSIQSLRMENSVLYVGNKEYKLPVSFSGVGSLAETKHIVFPIDLKNNYLNLNAKVDVDISYASTTWTMEVINGSLTLPGLPAEDLKGTAILKTQRGNFSALSFAGTLRHEQLTKDLVLEISPASSDRFSVRSTLTVPKNIIPTTYLLNLSNVFISKDFKSFETRAPIFLKITDFQQGSFKADAIQFSANGLLKCDLNGCSYQVQKKSDLIVFSPSYPLYDMDLSITYPLRITIEPTKANSLAFKDKKIDFDIIFNKTVFDVRKKSGNTTYQKSKIDLTKSQLKGTIGLEDDSLNIGFISGFDTIDDDTFLLANGDLEIAVNENGFNSRLTAQRALLKTFDYFKPEVKLNMTLTSDYYFTAKIASDKNNLSLNLNGYYNPYASEVLTAVQTNNPIVFEKGQMSPFEISSLFSDQIKDATGSIDVKGQIYYKGSRSISGPLKILVNNASFTYGNTKVKNLNTVLNLSQLVPLGAQGGQNIFIETLTNVLPFSNVNAQVFLDASRKQFNLSSLSADIGNYQLAVDPMWYNYTSPIFNFALKGRTVPAQMIVDSTTLNDLKIQGNANIALSIQLENADVSLKSFEFSIPSDGMIAYTPKVYANSYLENLKQLDFRKLSVYLMEQDQNTELIFSSDNKSNKLKKKTNFRFKIKEPLEKYILSPAIVVPDFVSEERGSF